MRYRGGREGDGEVPPGGRAGAQEAQAGILAAKRGGPHSKRALRGITSVRRDFFRRLRIRGSEMRDRFSVLNARSAAWTAP